jgi:hypothetical protein
MFLPPFSENENPMASISTSLFLTKEIENAKWMQWKLTRTYFRSKKFIDNVCK